MRALAVASLMRTRARDWRADAELLVAELFGDSEPVEVSGVFEPNNVRRS